MEIKLQKMTLRNFKAVKEFEFEPNGKSMAVLGQMGTGKSTLYDAFWFGLFGKDSAGNSKFEWKPKDKNNKQINHLETEIKLLLMIDGEEVELSRMVAENWVRKTGAASEEYTGDVTTCRVNGVKKKVSDYKKFIDELIDEETFKQLTNVYYFADEIKSDKRREILFDLVGDLDDSEVINSKESLKPLSKLIGSLKIDEKRKQLQEEAHQLRNDINEWTIRIDETDRNIPDIEDLNEKELLKQKEKESKMISDLKNKINTLENGGLIAQKRMNVSELELKLREMRNDHIEKQREKNSDLITKNEQLQTTLHVKTSESKDLNFRIEQYNKTKENILKEKKQLNVIIENMRNEYKTIAAEVKQPFDEDNFICQCCNRPFEESEKENIKTRYLKEVEAFNLKKASDLADINAAGKSKAKEIEALEEKEKEILNEQAELIETYNQLILEIEKTETEAETLEKQLQEKTNETNQFESSDVYRAVIKEIEIIKNEIDNEKETITKEVGKLNEQLQQLESGIWLINEHLNDLAAYKKAVERKENLIEEQKEKGKRAGDVENWLFLLDDFTRTKVALLTDKINSEFEITTFKLFEPLLNGGLKEVCEPLFEGKEFTGAISNGERVNVGVDIINTISRLKGVSVPIFIDNAESVTVWHTKPKSQAIHLIATAKKPKLEVKTLGGK